VCIRVYYIYPYIHTTLARTEYICYIIIINNAYIYNKIKKNTIIINIIEEADPIYIYLLSRMISSHSHNVSRFDVFLTKNEN